MPINGGRSELHFKRNKQFVHGGIRRYPLEAVATDPKSARVTVVDASDSSAVATFELPGTPADRFTADMEAALRAVEVQAQLVAAVNAGQWWLSAELLTGFGFLQKFSMSETDYLGGWSGHPKGHKHNIVEFAQAGIAYKAFKTLFVIPWGQVDDILVEGADQAASRVTATRLVGMGVFALAAKKRASRQSSSSGSNQARRRVSTPRSSSPPRSVPSSRRSSASCTRPARRLNRKPWLNPPSKRTANRRRHLSLRGSRRGAIRGGRGIELARRSRDAGEITDEQFAAERDKLMT